MIQLTDVTVLVNNEAVAYMPNSLGFREGKGEQTSRAAAVGAGKTETVYGRNLESNVGMIKFNLPATRENIALALEWKNNGNQNVVSLAGSTPDGDFNRTMNAAAVTNDYDVELGSETDIALEFHGDPLI